MDGIMRSVVGHDVSTLWHVFAKEEWHAIQYDGYAPVSVEIDGRLHHTEYRHLAANCDRADCAGKTVTA